MRRTAAALATAVAVALPAAPAAGQTPRHRSRVLPPLAQIAKRYPITAQRCDYPLLDDGTVGEPTCRIVQWCKGTVRKPTRCTRKAPWWMTASRTPPLPLEEP